MNKENKIPTDKKIWLECECGMHCIRLESTYIADYGVPEHIYHDYDFAIFNHEYRKHGLWNRLKFAWKYIKTGKMHEDQIILKPFVAQNLADFINKTIKEESHESSRSNNHK